MKFGMMNIMSRLSNMSYLSNRSYMSNRFYLSNRIFTSRYYLSYSISKWIFSDYNQYQHLQ